MASKSLSTGHSESKTPSSTSSISSKIQNTTNISKHLDKQSPESPEVQDLIHKLKGFSLSLEESEISEGSVNSKFVASKPLTRLQSEKLGIPPK